MTKKRSLVELEKKDLEIIDVWEKYEFNEEEKKEISKRLANENQNKQRLEDEKKAVVSNFKAKIDSAISQVNLLSSHIASGYEHRYFKCYKVLNFSRTIREYYNIENGELIKEEAFSREDHQLKLNFRKKKK